MTAGAIRDGASWEADARESTDVLVIGTGCGGATLGKALAEAGHDVTFVEKGGHWPRAELDGRERHMLAKLDGGRGLDTSDDGGVALTYGNAVGGASVHYWGDSYRLPADRLADWEAAGVSGHGADVLAPLFDRLERDLSVHLPDEAEANANNRRLRAGAEALGWPVARVPGARRGCVGSGHCQQGCPTDAKQSQLVTHLPAALAAGARIHADLEATLLHWEGPRVVGVTCQVLDRATGRPRGPIVRIDARAVVVAAGGFGTPRLLLKQGLKNRLPHLGEGLFVNPCPMVHADYGAPIVQWRGIPAVYGVEGFRRATREGPGPEGYRGGGYLLMPSQLHPGTLAAVLPGFGGGHRAAMRRLPELGGAISWVDDVERGRMTLEPGGRTRIHVPLLGENRLRIADAWKNMARVCLAAGAREVWLGDPADTRIGRPEDVDAAVDGVTRRGTRLDPGRYVLAAPHPGGAARMGRDAADSVVGPDHRVHDTENLYVADPSVFPSPPSVDPSLTIMAFSYVAAEAVRAGL